jgi:hypothetical protein
VIDEDARSVECRRAGHGRRLRGSGRASHRCRREKEAGAEVRQQGQLRGAGPQGAKGRTSFASCARIRNLRAGGRELTDEDESSLACRGESAARSDGRRLISLSRPLAALRRAGRQPQRGDRTDSRSCARVAGRGWSWLTDPGDRSRRKVSLVTRPDEQRGPAAD